MPYAERQKQLEYWREYDRTRRPKKGRPPKQTKEERAAKQKIWRKKYWNGPLGPAARCRKNERRRMRYATDPTYRARIRIKEGFRIADSKHKAAKRRYDIRYRKKKGAVLLRKSREYYYAHREEQLAKRCLSQKTRTRVSHQRATRKYARKLSMAFKICRALHLLTWKSKHSKGAMWSRDRRKIERKAVVLVKALGYVWKGNTWRLS